MNNSIVAPIKKEGVADLKRQNGVTYLSVTSDGTTGKEWFKYFKSTGHEMQYCTKDALLSPWFKATNHKTYKIVIVKDHQSKDLSESMVKNFEEIMKGNLEFFNLEAACLVWRKW